MELLFWCIALSEREKRRITIMIITSLSAGSPRVCAAAHLHAPGPFPKQAPAQAPGPGRRHLVGDAGQAPAHAQEGRQGALPER